MTGGVYEKNGKYYAVINLKDENGKRKKKWIPTGLDVKNNKRKAEMILHEIIREYEIKENISSGSSEPPVIQFTPTPEPLFTPSQMPINQFLYAKAENDILFTDMVKKWLVEVKEGNDIELNTYQFYESLCENHIIPFFDKKKFFVSEITTEILQDFIDKEEKSGNKHSNKKALSPRSLKHLKVVLNQIFKKAMKDRIITLNPCSFVKIPKQQKKIPSFYNEEQLKILFDKIRAEELYPLIYVTVMYGLRRSEVLGLKWDSVDFDNKTVTIKHTVIRFSEVIEKDSTKTESSYRTYPLPPEIETIFLKQKEREKRGHKRFGELYEENDYIFKWDYGKPYAPDFVTRKFSKLLKSNELPSIRFHDLRHSCASLLLSKGFTLKDIQEWLGHSDIEITANIYTHLDQERKKNIMSSITI